MCMFCRSLFVLSSFFCWPLCFLFYRFWLPLWCLQTLICITCLMHDIVVSTLIFRCFILPAKSSQFGKPNFLKQFPTVVSYLDYPHQLFRTLTIPISCFLPWLSPSVLSYLDYPHQFFRTLTIPNSCFVTWLSPTVVSYHDYPHQLFPTLTIPISSFVPWLSPTVVSYLDYPHQFFRTLTIPISCYVP